jgi:hypothetical protein
VIACGISAPAQACRQQRGPRTHRRFASLIGGELATFRPGRGSRRISAAAARGQEVAKYRQVRAPSAVSSTAELQERAIKASPQHDRNQRRPEIGRIATVAAPFLWDFAVFEGFHKELSAFPRTHPVSDRLPLAEAEQSIPLDESVEVGRQGLPLRPARQGKLRR